MTCPHVLGCVTCVCADCTEGRRQAQIASLTASLRLLQECQCARCKADPLKIRSVARVRAVLERLGAAVVLVVALVVGGCRTQLLELEQLERLDRLDQVAHQVDAGEQLDQLPAGPPDLLDPLCHPIMTPACPHPVFPDGGTP